MSPRVLTLSIDEYEALIAMAREGCRATTGPYVPDKARQLDQYLKLVEQKNGITRSAVWVQWQELEEPLPKGTNFPESWPPEMRAYIERTDRLVSRSDVEELLDRVARKPQSVLVTADPGAIVGWTTLDLYFR
jgi:hypothetical protein